MRDVPVEPDIDLTRYVRRGDGIWWSQAAAEPQPLINLLLDRAEEIGDVRAFTGLSWNERLAGETSAAVSITSYGALGVLRKLSNRGRLEILPVHLSALPRLFERGLLPSDVGLVQVAPPGPDGACSLGFGVDYAADAIPRTRTLIAEINGNMPDLPHSPRVPLERFAATIETERPLPEMPSVSADPIDDAIAHHVAGLVEDGDTIQVGVGSLADAVLRHLKGHAHLGFHSGMVTTAALDLIDCGVLTGSRKEVDAGIAVGGTLFGDESRYAGIGNYPVAFRPVSYTHHPALLSRFRRLVSINSAIEIDLLGQVGAELRGHHYIGGIGGQVDFSRAATLTGARSIITLRSTSRGASTIVPQLRGAAVTTARADVDAVVTEHGVAHLTGLVQIDRARRLIAVAAPEHREQLESALTSSMAKD